MGSEGSVGRVRSLDALRGIAALAVVIFHLTDGFDQDQFFPGYEPAAFQFRLGRYGVSLFFMISGFVILMSLRRSTRLADFAISRFSRLYPPFWAALGITSLYILWIDPDPLRFTPVQWIANLTMVPQWFGQREVDDVYWTLGIEMGFYVLAGLMFAVGLTRREKIIPTLAVVYALDVGIPFLLRAGGSPPYYGDFTSLFVGGMALFVLVVDRPTARREVAILSVIIFGAFVPPAIWGQQGSAAVTAGISVIMFLAVHGHLRFLENRPLLFLGDISYSLYLLHAYPGYISLMLLLDAGVQRDVAIVIVIAQSMALAVIVNRLVEKKVSPWLRRRLASTVPPRAASPA